MSGELSCFKAYDIRGRIPDELNEDLAYRLGRAYCRILQPRRVAVGHDVRLSSPGLSAALTRGLLDGGTDVLGYWLVRHGGNLFRHLCITSTAASWSLPVIIRWITTA
jgi:phosphomannomutase